MSALVDTNFIYAFFNRRDKNHQVVRAFFLSVDEDLLLPTVVLSEVAYHLHQTQDNVRVAASIKTLFEPPYRFVEPIVEDYQRAIAILEKYHDSRIDFVDACIMGMAERLTISRILTFDHRDFGMVRPSHIERFDLLP